MKYPWQAAPNPIALMSRQNLLRLQRLHDNLCSQSPLATETGKQVRNEGHMIRKDKDDFATKFHVVQSSLPQEGE